MTTAATAQFIAMERKKLLGEQTQVSEELTHLREFMQA